MLKVAAYTGGRHVPSARFRVRQHVAALAADGVSISEFFPALGSYPPRGCARRILWASLTLAESGFATFRSHSADLTLLQREMISTLVTVERWTKRPRVLDVDDAIFLHRGGAAARRLAVMSDLVICGNDYLAGVFSAWNSNVSVLPTAVDTNRFVPRAPIQPDGRQRIGWSGTSSGFRYLYSIAPALARVLSARPDACVTVIADRPPSIPGLPPDRVEFVPWSEESEVGALQNLAVGLMPLDNSPWSRGKCSFKLLTYMACGIPAVASPVGMNGEVLAGGGGVPASSLDDWARAVGSLLDDPAAGRQLGAEGAANVRMRYSASVIAPRLGELLRRCA